KQYGKTYLDDFPNLTAMAKRRLSVIKELLNAHSPLPNAALPRPHSPSLLDIGCAYGPFLAAAREEGFMPYGIDPSQDAVQYVTQTLGIPAIRGFFPLPDSERRASDSGLQIPDCDVISLWYVIEHFGNCGEALAGIKKILKPGGILAFSTPSYSGISGRSSLKRFLENSPPDHWTVWSPSACKKALKKAGFTVKNIVCTGHHPERFPFAGKFAGSPKSPLYGILMFISRIFSLGDTFEVYAVGSRE
ncbi:MAG: class I SAM-dependent methyltransferase, partial [Treponema sp.]|nr:class I SAM-dependent methyltransferase [Treponema sp.]